MQEQIQISLTYLDDTLVDVTRKTTYDQAVKATRYRLGYITTDRVLTDGGLDGPDIPCSYAGVTENGVLHPEHPSSGDWYAATLTDPETVAEWTDFWLRSAMDEAIHEALEHFHVKGKPWINPHDPRYEVKIFELTSNMISDILALRESDDHNTKN